MLTLDSSAEFRPAVRIHLEGVNCYTASTSQHLPLLTATSTLDGLTVSLVAGQNGRELKSIFISPCFNVILPSVTVKIYLLSECL